MSLRLKRQSRRSGTHFETPTSVSGHPRKYRKVRSSFDDELKPQSGQKAHIRSNVRSLRSNLSDAAQEQSSMSLEATNQLDSVEASAIRSNGGRSQVEARSKPSPAAQAELQNSSIRSNSTQIRSNLVPSVESQPNSGECGSEHRDFDFSSKLAT